MNIYEGSICGECGREAKSTDEKPYHRCRKCGARLKPNMNRDASEIDREYEFNQYRIFWRRSLAFLLDLIVIGGVSYLLQFGSGLLPSSLAWILLILSVALGPTYAVILHYKFGQTLGKRITQIKVIDVSETRLMSLGQSITRSIIPVIVATLYICVQILISAQFWVGFSLSFELQIKIMAILVISFFLLSAVQATWGVLELITMLFNDKRRALHDYLARSVVVINKK